jgi:hypothetical protein
MSLSHSHLLRTYSCRSLNFCLFLPAAASRTLCLMVLALVMLLSASLAKAEQDDCSQSSTARKMGCAKSAHPAVPRNGKSPPCDPGFFRHKEDCKPCPIGFYCAGGKKKNPEECPPGFTTASEGASSCDLCIPESTPVPKVSFSLLPSYNGSGVVINPAVLLVDSTSVFLSCNVTTLVLPSDQATALRVGSVLVGTLAGFNPDNPTGDDAALVCQLISRVVTNISTSGPNTILTTRPATLLDLVIQADFDATANIPDPEPIDVTDLLAAPAPIGRSFEMPAARKLPAMHLPASSEAGTSDAALRQDAGDTLGQVTVKLPVGDLEGIVEAELAFEPRFSVSVTGGVAYTVDAPASASLLDFIDPKRLQAFSATLRVEVAAGFVLNSTLSSGLGKSWSKDVLENVKPIQKFFPCVPNVPLALW